MEPHHNKTGSEPEDVYASGRTLKIRYRNRIREHARDALIRFPNDREAAELHARHKVQQEFGSIIGVILLGVAIKLAVDFIVYWIENLVTEPQAVYQSGEPGFPQDDETEDA